MERTRNGNNRNWQVELRTNNRKRASDDTI